MLGVRFSIRFFDDLPVRSAWDDGTAKWWICASDAVTALVDTKNPRIYWATVKRRDPELFANCKQMMLPAKDGKRYQTDVLDEEALNALIATTHLNYAIVLRQLGYEDEEIKALLEYALTREIRQVGRTPACRCSS